MIRDALLLYVSSEDDPRADGFKAEIALHKGFIYHATETLDALGAYVTYAPHAVLLDMSGDPAPTVYEHLRSVDAAPLIVLVDDIDDAPRAHDVYALPRALDSGTLVTAVEAILSGKGHLVLRKLIEQNYAVGL